MEYRLEMTTMFTIHDAFRRDLVEIARVAADADRSGSANLHRQLGWQLFKKFLLAHHQTEDDVVWPVLRSHIKGDPDRIAVIDALEAEHCAIEPWFTAIGSASGFQNEDVPALVGYVGELSASLTAHLAHEESDGLALIDEFLAVEEWQTFGREHGRRLVDDASMYVPWLLDQASPTAAEKFLRTIPPPLAATYRERWGPAYAALEIWDAPVASATTNPQGS